MTYGEICEKNKLESLKRTEEFEKLSPKQKMIQKILASIGLLLMLYLVLAIIGVGKFGAYFIFAFSLIIFYQAFKNQVSKFLNIYFALFGGTLAYISLQWIIKGL